MISQCLVCLYIMPRISCCRCVMTDYWLLTSSSSWSKWLVIHGNCWPKQKNKCLTKTKNSMLLQHVKELIEIVFQLISVTKVQHFGRALSVSVRLCPNMSEYVCFCPFTVTGRCHTARLCTSRLPGAAACREVLRLIWRVRHCGVTATSERFSLLRPPFRRAGLLTWISYFLKLTS